MTFRRLYWIAEEMRSPETTVTGVYTSIPDLVHNGLQWCNGGGNQSNFRLTLVKPDTFNCPLGRWDSKNFGSIRTDLEPFVTRGEFSIEESQMLAEGLSSFLAG